MMNLNPEDQQNGRTEEQSTQEQFSNDQTTDQRRILEERLAEINAQKAETAPSVEQVEEVPSVESRTEDKADEVAVPQLEPSLTQSSVLVSEEPIAVPATDENVAAGTVANEPILSERNTTAPEPASEVPAMETTGAAPETTLQTSTEGEQPATSQEASAALIAPHDEIHPEEDEMHPQEDYTHLSIDEIRAKILSLAQEGNVRKTGRDLNILYRMYEPLFQEERQQALNRFIAEGGAPDDFDYNAPKAHKDVEQAMQRFREARFKEQRQEEEQKVQNLQKKRDLLERLRVLIESETQTSGSAIKELQNEWKAIGQVPTAEAQQLWNSYHALLDMYYNNRSIFFELKELDRKRNLDAKNALCERAEALANEENINKALQELRHLHDEWKHIGPIPNEVRDQVWNRFIQASEQVHERKKSFFETRRNEELGNLAKKKELLAQIEQFQHFKSDRINDWRDKTDQIQQLKESWDAAGLVPKENAEEVNKAFWSSYKAFFHHKNTFFKALDEEKMQNYRQKVALCEEAESVQGSEEWDSTKEKLIQLQKKWKTIGRVPDKYSDKIWNRFRTACNAFFDRLHQEAQNKETQLNQLSVQKQAYCEQLASKVADPTLIGTVDEFNQIHQEWQSFASEGKRNPKVEDRFQQLLAKYLEKVPELSPQQKEQTLFQLQLNHLKTSPDGDQKLYQKEQHLRRDITSLENDISTLKTNIEFFARSKNAEKLREEYQSKIDEAQNRIQHLKRQLKALRS
ncbi:DUF349 domain-containing protein [Rufibacter sediminis]|uniref:DUF349 domain-containing protein n=1 Tax=Rufibacter sediminis TaxID=2762756 RepID=A0ABR6VRB7_9BACT|nr:DUF349 domain-containing protein [Rufibacter sediminis]MBC3539695.1 DUF349 domain-containing protein [Rufibacter sediminis]